jgi:hypothetical protein
MQKEIETMYSPFPYHHYDINELKKLPTKHGIVDLKRVL